MSYSLDRMPNAPHEFPSPPPFVVWVEDSKASKGKTPVGQIRHLPDLAKAKARIRGYCAQTETFRVDWAVYRWNEGQDDYVLQYEGRVGETVAKNELFQKRLSKDTKTQARPGLEDEVSAALASIAAAIK